MFFNKAHFKKKIALFLVFILTLSMFNGFGVYHKDSLAKTNVGDIIEARNVPLGGIIYDENSIWTNNKPINWIVVSKDHYVTKDDDGNRVDSVTLITESSVSYQVFDDSGRGYGNPYWSYSQNALRAYLNSTFENHFSDEFKALILTTTVPNSSGVNTTYDKFFPPSFTELGYKDSRYQYKPAGSYFDKTGGGSTSKRGSYWTRNLNSYGSVAYMKVYNTQYEISNKMAYQAMNVVVVMNIREDAKVKYMGNDKYLLVAKTNTQPLVSISTPTNNQAYSKYQTPQFSYNVYDVDNDVLTGSLYYNNNEAWTLVRQDPNLSNGSNVSFLLDTVFWNSLPVNTNLNFKVTVDDGTDSENSMSEQLITIKKTNNNPTIVFNAPANNSSFATNNIPTFKAIASDIDGDALTVNLQHYNGSSWVNVASKVNVGNGETVSLKPSVATWKSYAFNQNLTFRFSVSDTIGTAYTSNVNVIKTNTSPNVAILKPVNNERMFSGYLPFSWTISDIDNDNVHLKIWTDTPNVVNGGVLFNQSLGSGPYIDNQLFKVFLPTGTHNIYFQFSGGYHVVNQTRQIEIEEMVSLNIDNNPTFYIPVFEQEKSDVYYKKVDNMLDTDKYMFNILKLPENEQYIDQINGIENVTNDSDLSNNGDKIYSTDGVFDVLEISDWIYSKVSSDENPIIKVIPVNSKVVLKNIEFFDEDEDYTSTVPYNQGKDRQFKFEHYPQFYQNSDDEISENGIWLMDDTFTVFDGHNVERNDTNMKLFISKAGKYILSAKESDDVENYSGVDFSKTSDIKQVEVYAHRFPEAIIKYTDNGNQTLKLISASYDADFETRSDKGIQQMIWEYRLIDYEDNLIQDWKPISNINAFAPNVSYKTDIRLTVKDYGARIDLMNDGELTSSVIITIDALGKPPVADFQFKVGTSDTNAVSSGGVIFKGNVGHETIQLDDSSILWNDFYGSVISRNTTWSKNESQLNTAVMANSSLATTLTIRNKYNLTDAITKSVAVRMIDINDQSAATSTQGRKIDFNIDLLSQNMNDKWGNFKVTLTSSQLGKTNTELNNIISNTFELNNVTVPSSVTSYVDYTIKIYSKRTNELISQYDKRLVFNQPPTGEAHITPDVIFEGDSVYLNVKASDPDLDDLTINTKVYKGVSLVKTYTEEITPIGNIYPDKKQLLLFGNDTIEGNYMVETTIIDEYNKSVTLYNYFTVQRLTIDALVMTGLISPPYGTNIPVYYPVYSPTAIKAGYRMTFSVSANGGDYVDIKLFSNGERLTVHTDDGQTDLLTKSIQRDHGVAVFSFWVDENIDVYSVLDMKIELTRLNETGEKKIIDTIYGERFAKIIGSSKEDSGINQTY